jgi:2,5-diketo-D-gluconate reductase A
MPLTTPKSDPVTTGDPVPSVELNNGVSMPQIGFGVFQIADDDVVRPVRLALDAGYRSIDTAAIYGNEVGVGKALAQSGVQRSELFVTTKVWNADHGYSETLRAFEASLDRLQLDYLDMYLIHWPTPAHDKYVDTWRALEALYAEGRVRAIGVSNFTVGHLERLLGETDITPAVNQIELHPQLPQAELRAYAAEKGIVTEAWSPLARGEVLRSTVLGDIARRHGKTPAQVVLRWHLHLGNIVIPRSVSAERIAENIDVLDFELSDAEVRAITALETGVRIGSDPETMNQL